MLHAQISGVKNEIQQRLKQLKCEAADHLATTIGFTDESRRMFEAVKQLNNKNHSVYLSPYLAKEGLPRRNLI